MVHQQLGDNSIGRITTAGVVTNYTGTGINGPLGITTGPDGALWFTNNFNNSIGRITTAGVVTNYTDPSISSPCGITAGPDGALWFTNRGNNSIGRITTAGVVTNYIGTGINDPYRIMAGPGGALWFTNQGGNSIGRITTTGVVTNYPDPQINSPGSITVGPDGARWFTNGPFDSWSIGRSVAGLVSATMSTLSAKPPVVAANGVASSTVTVTVKDANGIPVPGVAVSLNQGSRSNSVISRPSGPSDTHGRVTFKVRDTKVEKVTYKATDTPDGVTVTQTVTVSFRGNGN